MKKIYRKKQLQVLKEFQQEILEIIKEAIITLDKNYGEIRDVDSDLGGYVL